MSSAGRITSGLKSGTLVEQTIAFVRGALAAWRDDRTRPAETAEEALNAQLCKFLNARARVQFPMVQFNHEERQSTRYKVDLSATRLKALVGGESIYEPVLVLEGKRLPAPSHDREREYLTGLAQRSGGIQRFKLALHGSKLGRAMIVAYVQNGAMRGWVEQLNAWVDELAASPTNLEAWDASDRLRDFEEHAGRTASCRSDHARPSGPRIRLDHAWVDMRGKGKT